MSKVQLATQIHPQVKKALEAACETRGLKIGHFIQEAILDKLEELEDISDLRKLRAEPTRPLAEIIKDLERSDKI